MGVLTNIIQTIRRTNADKIAGVLRLLLGGLFVMAGIMKLFVPMLGDAFSGQLNAAKIPFHTFNVWFVPLTEVGVGGLLILGLFSRIGALLIIPMMLVATYTHLVVNNPALFPLQPEEPIIPIITILAALYIIWRGGGSWSMDINSSD